MSFFNQISANTSLVTDTKGKVTCDARTKKLITSWIKNEQWQFDDFATFIELIGIQTPVRISKNGNSFKCNSADGKEVTISLFQSEGPEFCSGIYVKSENRAKRWKKIDELLFPICIYQRIRNWKLFTRYPDR